MATDNSVLPAVGDIIATDKRTNANAVDEKFNITKVAFGARRTGDGLTAGAADGRATMVTEETPMPMKDRDSYGLLLRIEKELRLMNYHLAVISDSGYKIDDIEDK